MGYGRLKRPRREWQFGSLRVTPGLSELGAAKGRPRSSLLLPPVALTQETLASGRRPRKPNQARCYAGAVGLGASYPVISGRSRPSQAWLQRRQALAPW